MSTVRFIEKNVLICTISQTTSNLALEELLHHIWNGLIRPQDYTVARLDYNTSKRPCSPNPYHPSYFPLKFISEDSKQEVWLSCVSTGKSRRYGAAGTGNTIRALRMMGFEVTHEREEEIRSTPIAHFEFMK